MREPDGVRQSRRAGIVAANCESIYKNYDLHDLTAAVVTMTKAMDYLNKIKVTRPDIGLSQPIRWHTKAAQEAAK